jgi:hypothetical protein
MFGLLAQLLPIIHKHSSPMSSASQSGLKNSILPVLWPQTGFGNFHARFSTSSLVLKSSQIANISTNAFKQAFQTPT